MNLCTSCPLYRQAKNICIGGEGFGDITLPPKDFKTPVGAYAYEIMLVAQNPGEIEDIGNRVLIGPTGNALRAFLRDNFPEVRFYLTNAVKCHTSDNKTPTSSQAKACASKHLLNEIAEVKPKAIIALGAVAWQALESIYQTGLDFAAIVGGGVQPESNKMQLGFPNGLPILAAAYHPSLSFETNKSIKGTSAAVQGSRVFRQLCLIVSSLRKRLGFYNFGENLLESVDVENDSRGQSLPWKGEPLVIGRHRHFGPIIQLESPPRSLFGWNVGYDMMVLWEKYGYYVPNRIIDVKAWSRLLEDEEPTALGLKQSAFQQDRWLYWGPRVPRKKYVDGLMAFSHAELSDYNTKDCYTTRVLYEKYNLIKYTSPKNLQELCDLDSDVLGLICPSMEWHGIAVNNTLISELKEHHHTNIVKITAELEAEEEVLDSPKKFGEYLRSRGYKVPAGTGALELDVILKDNQQALSQIQEYRYSKKVYGTFLEQMLKYQDALGRVHFPYAGLTETGRLRNRGLHQIPKGDSVRSCLIPSKGKVFLKADVNQLEIGGIALQSGDENLIEAVKGGVDVHAKTLEASRALGVSTFERAEAKAFNFAAMFGGSAMGLSKRFGIEKKHSQALIKYLYEQYPKLKSWHESVEKQLFEVGFVESIFGRKRRNFKEFDYGKTLEKFHRHFLREAINFQIQSYGADLTKELMRRTFDNIGQNLKETKLLMYIHDELVLEGPSDEIESLEISTVKAGENVLGVEFPFDVTWSVKKPLACWE